jgi:hypothetical protein
MVDALQPARSDGERLQRDALRRARREPRPLRPAGAAPRFPRYGHSELFTPQEISQAFAELAARAGQRHHDDDDDRTTVIGSAGGGAGRGRRGGRRLVVDRRQYEAPPAGRPGAPRVLFAASVVGWAPAQAEPMGGRAWIRRGRKRCGGSLAPRSKRSKAVMAACPDRLWSARAQRRELEFWYLAFHTLFWLDCYLTQPIETYAPPPPSASRRWIPPA